MHIDCAHCRMRDLACDDCVVTALLGALADVGMVPPLRLVVDDAEAS